jgi:hypothetical protein
MPLVKTNFRRWGGLVVTGGVGGVAALPPSGAASFLVQTGAVFMSGSVLYVWNGGIFTGFSANISASGS